MTTKQNQRISRHTHMCIHSRTQRMNCCRTIRANMYTSVCCVMHIGQHRNCGEQWHLRPFWMFSFSCESCQSNEKKIWNHRAYSVHKSHAMKFEKRLNHTEDNSIRSSVQCSKTTESKWIRNQWILHWHGHQVHLVHWSCSIDVVCTVKCAVVNANAIVDVFGGLEDLPLILDALCRLRHYQCIRRSTKRIELWQQNSFCPVHNSACCFNRSEDDEDE